MGGRRQPGGRAWLGVFSSAVTLPLQMLVGFTQVSTVVLARSGRSRQCRNLALDQAGGRKRRPRHCPSGPMGSRRRSPSFPWWRCFPGTLRMGVIVGWTASDHSKVAMIDEMTPPRPARRQSVLRMARGAGRVLSYYYLWHFSAAQVSILPEISGMGGGRRHDRLHRLRIPDVDDGPGQPDRCHLRAAGGDEPARRTAKHALNRDRPSPSGSPFSVLAGSLKPALAWAMGWDRLGRLLATYRDLETWLAQASWVPQHLASAGCAVLAVLLLVELSEKPRASRVLLLGALAAAAFGSSAWIGGRSLCGDRRRRRG